MLMTRKGAPTCFYCLQPGSVSHNSRTCKAPRRSVDECGRKHHELLHIATDRSKVKKEDKQSFTGFVSTNTHNLLPTACARLIYEDEECSVRILSDSGLQETFLRTAIADDLKLKPHGSHITMKIKVLEVKNSTKE